jgi:glucan phosphoethanolaminetransferase (alkaline phosphatase superfamily)
MPIIVTFAVIVLAAFVSTNTSSADAFVAVLFVGPFAAVGLFYMVLLVRIVLRFFFVGWRKS